MKRLIQIVLVAALALATPAHAVKKYSCDFEDAAARARWTLNPTANKNIYNQLANKWYIGAPGNNDKNGSNGLYISDDGGANAHYRNTGCWVFAYDTISLDYLPTGDYTLSFDYSVMGNVASNFDGLYVLWIPMTDPEGDENGFLAAGKMAGRDDMEIAVFGNEERILLTARFDNLGKGACGAAIQNMNLVLGVEETTGLVL